MSFRITAGITVMTPRGAGRVLRVTADRSTRWRARPAQVLVELHGGGRSVFPPHSLSEYAGPSR